MLNRLSRLKRRYAQRMAKRRARRAQGGSDVQAFLAVARESFLQMQAAWDRADLEAMSVLATDALLEDLREQLAWRGPGLNRTEVLELHANLLALEEMRDACIASVEFSGLIREHLNDTAGSPFRELWFLANIKSANRGWQLARVQTLS